MIRLSSYERDLAALTRGIGCPLVYLAGPIGDTEHHEANALAAYAFADALEAALDHDVICYVPHTQIHWHDRSPKERAEWLRRARENAAPESVARRGRGGRTSLGY